MSTFIVLLRGINVGGHKKIKMADLRHLLNEASFKQVQTYIQSGNIILKSDYSKVEVGKKIAQIIDKNYGFEVFILVLSPKELAKAIEENPFKDQEEKKLYMTFLEHPPKPEFIKNNLPPKFDTPDKYQIIDKTVFLYYPNGAGRSKLTNNFWEQKLQLKATTRNWKTANKLAEMAQN